MKNTSIEESILKINDQTNKIREKIDVLECLDDISEQQENELTDLLIEERRLDRVLCTLTDLKLFGFVYERQSSKPHWYDDERITGTRFAITSGSSPFNEWYIYVDENELKKVLVNDPKALGRVNEVDGKIYDCEDIITNEDDTLSVKTGTEPLDISGLAHITSVF